MTKSQRRSQTFKKGDIVSPFSNVKSSNSWRISNIIRAEIVKVEKIHWSSSYKQEITIRILEGNLIGDSHKRIVIYSNSIELNSNTGNYDIY